MAARANCWKLCVGDSSLLNFLPPTSVGEKMIVGGSDWEITEAENSSIVGGGDLSGIGQDLLFPAEHAS